MKRLALLLVVVYPCLATDPCPDTVTQIHAMCTITGIRNSTDRTTADWSDRCTLETMPGTGGLRNLIRITVNLADGSPVATNLAPITDFVKSESTVAGDAVITSLLWGKITVSPACSGTRASISQRAPAIEIRPQTLTVSLVDPSTLEIRVEEGWADFDGRWPSANWTTRYLNSFTQLSHAK